MKKYIIWEHECKNDNEKLVQIFNDCDAHDVREEFIEQGYCIVKTYFYADSCFILIRKVTDSCVVIPRK